MVATLFNLAGPDLFILFGFFLFFFGVKRIPALIKGCKQSLAAFQQGKAEDTVNAGKITRPNERPSQDRQTK